MPERDGSLGLETLDIISNGTYAANGYPHAAWTRLRREDPIHWNDRNIINPFWAVTKHADIVWISKQPERFLNGPRLAAFPEFVPPEGTGPVVVRHLLNMDPPDHAQFRKLASHRFTPRGLERMRRDIEAITRDLLDAMMGDGGDQQGDFVEKLSAPLPLQVLAELLGVPRGMWPTMFDWTNRVIGSADPEYQEAGDDAFRTAQKARLSLFGYFSEMARDRRAKPTDDIVSVVANATIDGEAIPERELLSFYFLLVVAGNETTRNAMTGGLLAFLENPEQWERLRRDPALVDSAVEEIVRWTTPVIQFCRTATEDVEIRGKKIRAGDNLCLFYPSANRDEDVFEDPFRFRIDRHPNRHIGFGIGEHFCLGANLARLELRVVFRQLAARLAHCELAGPVERLRSSFVGGIKRMPIRYRLTAGA
jgi:cholest-4-en-3-one 26-monooxygenase